MKWISNINTSIAQARRGIRHDDTFIVSYPKSGGSWFYTLVANAIYAQPGESLDQFASANYIPDINDEYFSGASLRHVGHDRKHGRFMFVHAPATPLFNKTLLVVRDVRDVMVSYYHWRKMKHADFKQSFEEFVLSNDAWPCAWDDFVNGWLDGKQTPCHVVRYEDLLKNTTSELHHALAAVGYEVALSQVEQAVESSRFDRMRKAERHNAEYMKTKTDKDRNFVRRGQAGGWQDELAHDIAEKLTERYSQTLTRLGYELEPSQSQQNTTNIQAA